MAAQKIRRTRLERTTTMKSGLIGLALTVLTIPVTANAQLTIDMGRITCDQYLAMAPSRSNDFSAWMSGWFSYKNDRTFVDIVAHQKNIASVKEWCKLHPGESVMTGLKNAIVIN
jgi:HdeA/HdeB family